MPTLSLFAPRGALIHLQGKRGDQEQAPEGEAGVLGSPRGQGWRRQRARGARARGRGDVASTIAATRGGRYRHRDYGHAASADGARDRVVGHSSRVERGCDPGAADAGAARRGLHRVARSNSLGVVLSGWSGRFDLVVGGGDRSGDHNLCLGFGLSYGTHGSANGHDLWRHGPDRAVRYRRRALGDGGGAR